MIIIDLVLALSIFIPFVRLPRTLRNASIAHSITGISLGMFGRYLFPDFTFIESLIVFTLWMTFFIVGFINAYISNILL